MAGKYFIKIFRTNLFLNKSYALFSPRTKSFFIGSKINNCYLPRVNFNVAKKDYLNLFAIWLIYIVASVIISFVGSFLSIIPIVGGLINLSTSLFVAFVFQPMIKVFFVDYYTKNRNKSRSGI